jgi:hypothetical protein
MRRSLGRTVLGLTLASALALGTGCAKDPTELVLTVTLDGTPARPITSFEVTLDAAGVKTSRLFEALGPLPADAYVPPFVFPATIRYLVPNGGIRGVVGVTVNGSDPLTNTAVLATGTGEALVQDHKTTSATIALNTVAPPDDGGGGGAGGNGGNGGGNGGSAGGGGASGAGGDGPGGGGGASDAGGTAGQSP